jgi:hypothetical protein
MAATDAYALHVYDEDLVKQAVIVDFLSLSYLRRVNWFDSLWFSLSGDEPILADIEDKWFFNLRRRRADGTWDDEFWGMFRDEMWTYGRRGSKFAGYCQGITSFLMWNINNWPTGTASRTAWTSVKGETFMKTFTDYNIGPNALQTNGRKHDGNIRWIKIETDGAAGNTITSHYNFGVNVLQELADMAVEAGGDFKIVYDPQTSPSTTYFTFEWYTGQMGTDRSATVTFSMAIGNMANPQFKITRSSEKTVACVWGKGEGSDRDYKVQTGPNFVDNSPTTFGHDIEVYVDARSVDEGDTNGLKYKGDAKLEKLKSKETFTFDIQQSESYTYKEDYDLGDLVTAINPFNGNSSTYKIWSIGVKVEENGRETIEVELGD